MKRISKECVDPDPEMDAEYDFTGGVVGKYAERYAAGHRTIVTGRRRSLSSQLANQVYRVLKEAGRPLTTKEVAASLQTRGWLDKDKRNVQRQVSAVVSRDRRIRKIRRIVCELV